MTCQVELAFSVKNDTLFIVGIQPQYLTADARPGMILRQRQKAVEAVIDSIEHIDRPNGVLIGLRFKKGDEIAWSRIKRLVQGDQIILD
ncbi:hypothetical protein GCM10028808_09050 [Spirosoma migulaei]